MADVGEQRANPPGERSRGGLQVASPGGIRIPEWVLPIPVQQAIQESVPDLWRSIENLSRYPLTSRSLTDKTDQQEGEGGAGRLDFQRMPIGPVMDDRGDPETAEELRDPLGQMPFVTMEGEPDFTVDAAANRADVSFRGVHAKEVAKVVVELELGRK